MKGKSLAISSIAFATVITAVIIISALATYGYLVLSDSNRHTVSLTSIASTTFSLQVLHQLIFNQTGTCANPETYEAPWAVVLNNKTTVSQPPNSKVPSFASTWRRQPNYSIYSIIVFQVPSGQYNYSVYPLNVFLSQSGSVAIRNSDVTIHVQDNADGCTA